MHTPRWPLTVRAACLAPRGDDIEDEALLHDGEALQLQSSPVGIDR